VKTCAQDLKVEDTRPKTIVHFVQDSDTPVSLGILVDISASMASKPSGTISAMRAAVGTTRVLLKSMKRGDEFLLMSFGDGFSVEQGFTLDPARIDAAVRKLSTKGGTQLFPAVERGLQELRKSRHRKKALILITDAYADGNFDDLRKAINDSEVLIYTFVLRGMSPIVSNPIYIPPTQTLGTNTLPIAAVDDGSRRLLDALAAGSGGQSEIFEVNSAELVNRMIRFLESIAAELRGRHDRLLSP
jgi:hypothetical protein